VRGYPLCRPTGSARSTRSARPELIKPYGRTLAHLRSLLRTFAPSLGGRVTSDTSAATPEPRALHLHLRQGSSRVAHIGAPPLQIAAHHVIIPRERAR